MDTLKIILFYGGDNATEPREQLLSWLREPRISDIVGKRIDARKVSDFPSHSGRVVNEAVDEAIEWADLALALLTTDSRSENGAPNVVDEIGRWRSKKGGETLAIIRQKSVKPHSNLAGYVYIRYENEVIIEIGEKLLQFLTKYKLSLTSITYEPIEPQFPIFGITYRRNPNFTGREDLLAQIYKNLNKKSPDILMQALVGLGGVGKSRTAIEYAYRNAAEYDLVWWVRAEKEDGLVDDYIQLANELHLPVKGNAEKIAHINIVKDWLRTTSKKWLLIFDNAEKSKQVSDVLPVKGNGHVLITSRDQGGWGHLAEVLQIRSFSPKDAIEFLRKRTGIDDNINAHRLAELLGFFPLALEQAGSFISQQNLPFDTYIKLYQEQRDELWKREQIPQDYPKPLLTTWEMAFQQVKATSRPATALLNVCSFLSPDSIPFSIFTEGVMHLPEELATVVNSPFGILDIIEALSHYSLIERKEDNISIHRLVQDVSRELLGAERRKQWSEIALNLIDHGFTFDEYQLDTWEKCARLLPHIPTVIAHAKEESALPATAARLSHNMGDYFRHQGEFDEALQAIEHALSVRLEIFGQDNVAYARSLSYCGEVYHEKADFRKAYSCFEQALSIQQKNLGEINEDVARTLNYLGLLLQDQGKYDEAKPCLEEALAIRKQMLGDMHPATVASLNNMGSLLRVQGRYDAAKPYFEEALTIHKQVLGEIHPGFAIILNNLGLLLQSQTKYDEAKPYLEEAMVISKQVLGDMHPNVVAALENMGNLLSLQGKYDEAKPYLEEALTVSKQVLGDMHPSTGICLANVGTFWFDQKKYIKARPYLEQALKIYEDTHGGAHPTLVTILSNLGAIMVFSRQYVLARRYLQRARNICRNTDQQYAECEEIAQMLQRLPGKIGRKGKDTRRR